LDDGCLGVNHGGAWVVGGDDGCGRSLFLQVTSSDT
jgi:ABC-type molybdenum transport system ATPase subunit/photorepair protein PhrA